MHLHDNTGHMRIEKTMSKAEERFWWPGYVNDIQEWLRTCNVCGKAKAPCPRALAELQSIPVGGPMEILALDFVGPLMETERGKHYILVITDYFTKWAETFALKDQNAITVAKVLVDNVFSRYGTP